MLFLRSKTNYINIFRKSVKDYILAEFILGTQIPGVENRYTALQIDLK